MTAEHRGRRDTTVDCDPKPLRSAVREIIISPDSSHRPSRNVHVAASQPDVVRMPVHEEEEEEVG
ncbi:hypothetical protein E2C01_056665 [Portunus trituberculatus]|uniref:Uncharacterized protein n=1 Tax=Portunus trituberculatus TaxID=210409 RepID=A0A5B7GYB7_PORTR|nr:hypothetical protein [Portunus trituberculatus]